MNTFNAVREEFDEAVELRRELNSVHWKDYDVLKKVFAALFAEEPSTLKFISDMNYYKGGYPSENSPPKIDALVQRFGVLAKYYSLIGRLDEVNRLLAPYGFTVAETVETQVRMYRANLNENKAIVKAVNRAMSRFDFRVLDDAGDMVRWFLEQTQRLQGVICTMADEIKIDIFEKVEKKLDGEIDKSGFNTAVNTVASMQTKMQESKDLGPIVERALERSEVLGNNGTFLREKVTEVAK